MTLRFPELAEDVPPVESGLGERAARTRAAIVEAGRGVFLDRGYADTRIGHITGACGISRAGFYTYFRDKRDVFALLSRATHGEMLRVVRRWDAIGVPVGPAELTGWVREYFAFLDAHGAFLFAAGRSAPADDAFRVTARRRRLRAALHLGMALRARQASPTRAPEALGLATLAALEQAWHGWRMQALPVGGEDLVRTTVQLIRSSIGPERDAPPE